MIDVADNKLNSMDVVYRMALATGQVSTDAAPVSAAAATSSSMNVGEGGDEDTSEDDSEESEEDDDAVESNVDVDGIQKSGDDNEGVVHSDLVNGKPGEGSYFTF